MEGDVDPTATLIAALHASDKSKVRQAVDALIALCAKSAELQPRLERLLAVPGQQPVWPVAYVLGHLANPSSTTVLKLLESLDHPDSDIRWAIVLLLVRMAQGDGRVVTSLLELRKTGTPTQRRMVIYCMRDLKLPESVGLPAILDSLSDSHPAVRIAAATSLKVNSELDDSGKRALLKVFLNDPEVKVRNAAAAVLAQLPSPPEEFLSALRRATQGEDPIARKTALTTLALYEKKRSVPTKR